MKTAYAYATRKEADIYDVTYSDDAALDREVRGRYLQRLADDGYHVKVSGWADNPPYVILPSTRGK